MFPFSCNIQTFLSFLVDAREAVKGLIEIDSDLPVVNYDKIEDRNFKVYLSKYDMRPVH